MVFTAPTPRIADKIGLPGGTINAKRIRDAVAEALAARAHRRIDEVLESRTLSEAMRYEKKGGRWWVGVPHYWAIYYNDGRGPARPVRASFLVWYPNPTDDPRHGGYYPVRASQIQKLNIPWEVLRDDILEGRAIIAKVSPQDGGLVEGKLFFEKGLRDFFARERGLALAVWSLELRHAMPDAFRFRTEKLIVRI